MSKFYVGSVWMTEKFGEVEIIEKVDSLYSKVRFLSSKVEKVFRNDSVSSGKMSHEPYYIGSTWNTKNYGKVEVVSIIKGNTNIKPKVEILFLETWTTKMVSVGDLKKGSIKDEYNKKGYWGKGCLGRTSTQHGNGKNKRSFNVWHSMLKRCYDWENNCKAYKNVYVCDEWLCYENFEKWFDNNYIEGFELDKDFTKIGNNVYCPEFCSFIPNRLNGVLSPDPDKTSKLPAGVFNSHCKSKPFRARCYSIEEDRNVCLGYYESIEDASSVYKIYKQNLIKRLAKDYYDKGDIPKVVFNNLVNIVL